MMDHLEHSLLQNCSNLLQLAPACSALSHPTHGYGLPQCQATGLTMQERFGYKDAPPRRPADAIKITFGLTNHPDQRYTLFDRR